MDVRFGCIAGRKPKDALDRIRDHTLEAPHSDSKKTYSHGLLRGITAALSMQEGDRPQDIDALLRILDAPEASASTAPESAKTTAREVAAGRVPEATEPALAGLKPKPAGRTHAEVASRKLKTDETRGTGKWLVIALIPVLALAFGIYWWIGGLGKSPDNQAANSQTQQEPEQTAQKPQSEPADDPQYEGIIVRSDPPGASIFVDDVLKGVTPLSIKSLEPGRTATLRFQLEGYETDEHVVTAPTTGSRDVSMTLKKVIQKYALTIETAPADATVKILNIEQGYERGMLLEPGIYQAEISKDGFETQNVSIEMGDRDNSPIVGLIPLQSTSDQFSLGFKYYTGDGVEKDYQTAAKLFRMAADQGDVYSPFWLGIMYRNGEGVEQDYTKALQWFSKAAERGDSLGHYWLGFMHFHGEGVEQNYAKAFVWFKQAADQGEGNSRFWLGTMYSNGQGIEQDYAKAFQWFTQAADQGNADAKNALGNMYFNGQGIEQDYAKAFEWFTKAADQGNADAQTALGSLYVMGLAVAQDYAKAFEWFTKAVDQGNAMGQINLGLMYLNGQGVAQDHAKAFEWFTKAADQGDAYSQWWLGDLYSTGYFVAKDYAKAFEWFTKAADQGSSLAQYSLGNMYRYGQGVTEDREEAIKWYRKAASLGNGEAKKALADMGVSQ